MMSLKKDIPLYNIVVYFIVSVMTISLLLLLGYLEPSSNSIGGEILKLNTHATQTANAVTSVVAYFRSLDTLGEITILFTAVFGVSLMLEKNQKFQNILYHENNLLKIGIDILFPLIILFGIYIILHGHLSPGGGFQGGVIIASGFLLKFLSYGDDFELSHKIVSILESISGIAFVVLGLVSLLAFDIFLGNILPLGNITELFSSGSIALLYLFVGLKVSAEISILIQHFIKIRKAKDGN